MHLNFDSKVVLVTGAAQGIGSSIAREFRAAGARVHLSDVEDAGLTLRAQELGVPAYLADLSDRKAAAEVIAAVTEKEGRLDILVLAAGGVRGQTGQQIEDVSAEDWHALFAANVDAAFYVIQAAAPQMRARGWGRIVTISSSAGVRPSLTGMPGYTAAKHALVGLTRQASAELAPYGVTVNSVAPGLILSNPSSMRQWESYCADTRRQVLSTLHTGRLGTPADIASAALFLASEEAGWITGQIISVDGGRF